MLAIDLCCGWGGWAVGLLATGWEVIGFDIVPQPRYPAPMVVQDVQSLDGRRWRSRVDLIVASPPCTEFSRRDMRFAFPDAPEPDLALVHACQRLAMEAEAPLVLENVRGAIPYLGRPAARYRRRYLWGDGVPALIWPSIANSGKSRLSNWGENAAMKRAMIEPELSEWIGWACRPRALA